MSSKSKYKRICKTIVEGIFSSDSESWGLDLDRVLLVSTTGFTPNLVASILFFENFFDDFFLYGNTCHLSRLWFQTIRAYFFLNVLTQALQLLQRRPVRGAAEFPKQPSKSSL